jgi:hypothetical protein
MTGAWTRWLCVPTARTLVDAMGMSTLAALHTPGRRVAERASCIACTNAEGAAWMDVLAASHAPAPGTPAATSATLSTPAAANA